MLAIVETTKTTNGANACNKSARSGSLSWMDANEQLARTKVFSKSLKNHNMGVALATMIQKING